MKTRLKILHQLPANFVSQDVSVRVVQVLPETGPIC